MVDNQVTCLQGLLSEPVWLQTGFVYFCILYSTVHTCRLAGLVAVWPASDSDQHVWEETDQQPRECGGRGSGGPDNDPPRLETTSGTSCGG